MQCYVVGIHKMWKAHFKIRRKYFNSKFMHHSL